MNSRDIDSLVRWAIDTDLKKFAEDAYGVTGTAFEVASEGEYLRSKFKQMQSNFIMWISGLDAKNRGRLANHITFDEPEEDAVEKPEGVDVVNLNEHKEERYYENIDNIIYDMLTIGSKNKGPKNND
tara:strand:+ start:502 stop:882 length:381 start_codon:yes stop_codon:yes gene_type:complete